MSEQKPSIETLMLNRDAFSQFVYTPLDDAIEELKKRKLNEDLETYVSSKLLAGVPLLMKEDQCAVMFRQVATPNYELRRFISLIDTLDGFKPLFFEFKEDKYTDNNDLKYHLGKMSFFHGRGKKSGEKITRTKIIDFQVSRGKLIKEVRTLWGEDLTEFHHSLFKDAFGDKISHAAFFDASDWFRNSGGDAKHYYENFLRLFLKDGILFENFLIEGKEAEFTKNVFLPSLMRVIDESGHKPLIIALTPTEIESDIFWLCHPQESEKQVQTKIKAV